VSEFTKGGFQTILPEIKDIKADKVKRVVVCSGKVYYDLSKKREDNGHDDTVLLRLEQLYPFPHKAFAAELKKYPNATEVVWCQERAAKPRRLVLCTALPVRKHGHGPKAGLQRSGRLGFTRGGLFPFAPRPAKSPGRWRIRTPQGFHTDQISRLQRLASSLPKPFRNILSWPSLKSKYRNSQNLWQKPPCCNGRKVGEAVAADEILIDVETDKVVLEVPAPAAGVLVEIVAADGATVKAEELIARIDTTATASAAGPVTASAAAAKPAAAAAAAPVAASAAASASHAGVAMPAAAKLMADNHLASGSVPGTGKDGRVTKGDVLAAVAGGVQSTAAVIPTGVPTKALPQVVRPCC
jgi:hypothetical protein